MPSGCSSWSKALLLCVGALGCDGTDAAPEMGGDGILVRDASAAAADSGPGSDSGPADPTDMGDDGGAGDDTPLDGGTQVGDARPRCADNHSCICV